MQADAALRAVCVDTGLSLPRVCLRDRSSSSQAVNWGRGSCFPAVAVITTDCVGLECVGGICRHNGLMSLIMIVTGAICLGSAPMRGVCTQVAGNGKNATWIHSQVGGRVSWFLKDSHVNPQGVLEFSL